DRVRTRSHYRPFCGREQEVFSTRHGSLSGIVAEVEDDKRGRRGRWRRGINDKETWTRGFWQAPLHKHMESLEGEEARVEEAREGIEREPRLDRARQFPQREAACGQPLKRLRVIDRCNECWKRVGCDSRHHEANRARRRKEPIKRRGLVEGNCNDGFKKLVAEDN